MRRHEPGVGKYLENYPEMLDKDAESIVEKALMDAYRRPTDTPQ